MSAFTYISKNRISSIILRRHADKICLCSSKISSCRNRPSSNSNPIKAAQQTNLCFSVHRNIWNKGNINRKLRQECLETKVQYSHRTLVQEVKTKNIPEQSMIILESRTMNNNTTASLETAAASFLDSYVQIKQLLLDLWPLCLVVDPTKCSRMNTLRCLRLNCNKSKILLRGIILRFPTTDCSIDQIIKLCETIEMIEMSPKLAANRKSDRAWEHSAARREKTALYISAWVTGSLHFLWSEWWRWWSSTLYFTPQTSLSFSTAYLSSEIFIPTKDVLIRGFNGSMTS